MPKSKSPRPRKTFRADRRNRCKANRHMWPGMRQKFRLVAQSEGKVYPYDSKKRNPNAEAI